jgi:hypothetical protein
MSCVRHRTKSVEDSQGWRVADCCRATATKGVDHEINHHRYRSRRSALRSSGSSKAGSTAVRSTDGRKPGTAAAQVRNGTLINMDIELNHESSVLVVEQVYIPFWILKNLIKPDRRVLFRFIRNGNTVDVQELTENKVIWIDESEKLSEVPE